MMLTLLSHSRSGRFVSGLDQVFGCRRWGPQQNLAGFMSRGALERLGCVTRAPRCRHSQGWWHKLLSELHHSSDGKARLWELAPLFRGHTDGKWSVRGMSLSAGCVCTGKPLLWGLRGVCYRRTRQRGNCSICFLPTCANQCNTFGFDYEVSQSHTGSNRVYLCSYDLISPQPCFYWVMAKSTKK